MNAFHPFPVPDDIDATTLLLRLACSDPPLLLDLRLDEDVAEMPATLPGAIRSAHDDLATHLRLSEGRPVVAFCHKGLKLTFGAAARLVHARRPLPPLPQYSLPLSPLPVFRLTGGIVAWAGAGFPMTDGSKPCARVVVPQDCAPEGHPHIWAVLRYVCPRAEVIAVPAPHVSEVARTFDAAVADALPLPHLPEWPRMQRLCESDTMAAQLRACGNGPLAALPLLDAVYRGIVA